MIYNHDDDKNLTDEQKILKWGLYCECDMEEDENIITVLKSLLKDLQD